MDSPLPLKIDSVINGSLALIKGKWKASILCTLVVKGDQRFNDLIKELDGISPKILTKQLKEMENDGLIVRMVFPENPPKVLYSLSHRGNSLIPIIQSLADWGLKYLYSDNANKESELTKN